MTHDRVADLDRSPPDPVAAIRSDPRTLERFYRAHVDDVIGYFARRCTSPHDVADLTADTFVAAIDSAHRYDPRRARPIGWLMGIAHHVLLRQIRGRSTERRAVVRLAGRRLLDNTDIQRLEERIDAERRAQRILGDVAALTAKEREIVELVDGAGLTVTEAADALGVPAGVARVRRHRAHTRLKKRGNSDGEL